MVFKRNDNKPGFCQYCLRFCGLVYYIEMMGILHNGEYKHQDITGILIGQVKWFTVGEDPLLNTFCIRGYRDTVNTNRNDSIWQR